MNTKSRSTGGGFFVYAILILIVVLVWYWMGNHRATSSYTVSDLKKALEQEQVKTITVIQNREVPTGSLEITMDDEAHTTKVLYTSDVNEMQELVNSYHFDKLYVEEIPQESWIMKLLPYLLIFGAFFILFIIMSNNSAAQSGGSRMMNFGKSRAKLSTGKTTRLRLQMVPASRKKKKNLKKS